MDGKNRLAVLWHWLRNPQEITPADAEIDERLSRAEARVEELAEQKQRLERIDAQADMKRARQQL